VSDPSDDQWCRTLPQCEFFSVSRSERRQQAAYRPQLPSRYAYAGHFDLPIADCHQSSRRCKGLPDIFRKLFRQPRRNPSKGGFSGQPSCLASKLRLLSHPLSRKRPAACGLALRALRSTLSLHPNRRTHGNPRPQRLTALRRADRLQGSNFSRMAREKASVSGPNRPRCPNAGRRNAPSVGPPFGSAAGHVDLAGVPLV
jgi:hypothetical protein